MSAADLVRFIHAFPGATIAELADDDRGGHAVAYALAGWEVFPLRGKIPAISVDDGGHGLLDATTDLDQIAAWWTAMPSANIGGRVPRGCVALDVDPRKKGNATIARLQDENGPLPATRTCMSGGADGGWHLYFRHPDGTLTDRALDGVDLRTHKHYCVLPPSIHPETRRPYSWTAAAHPIVAMPEWLIMLLRPALAASARPRRKVFGGTGNLGDSIADWYTANHTWAEVLTDWRIKKGNGEDDGSTWQHPSATSPVSATIRHGLLFVYTTNTLFDPTGASDPHGYTRFGAYAVLEHNGDLSAAAKAAAKMRKAAA